MRLNTLLLKLAILISGRGSNMQAILNSIKKQSIPINPVIVISNKPTARGLRIAKRYGVKTYIPFNNLAFTYLYWLICE